MEEDLWVKKCETSINPLSKDLRGNKAWKIRVVTHGKEEKNWTNRLAFEMKINGFNAWLLDFWIRVFRRK